LLVHLRLLKQWGRFSTLPKRLLKPLHVFFTGIILFLFVGIIGPACSLFNAVNPIPYVPIVTFSGIVNSDSLFYPGNRLYPNTCVALENCVRMYFYSEDYSEGEMNSGDQMRLDVFPPDTQFITERHALFDLVRYDRILATPTYTITSWDTINDYNNLHIQVETFERRSGGAVSLKEMSVTARPLGQYASEPLIIKRGVIKGRIK
jgi:hypothetical protein